jgi:DnaJ-class molecular chaperone
MKYHPDLQPAGSSRQEAEENFKKISHAYQVLSDSRQRLEYDSANGFKGSTRYGNSSMRHADWNPQPSSSSSKHNHTSQNAKQYRPFNVNDHFNIPVWNAAHYGDETIRIDNIKFTNTWMNDAGPHQRYYQRKREFKEKQAREREEEMRKEKISNEEDASANLNRKREERRRNEQPRSTTAEKTKESDGGCNIT